MRSTKRSARMRPASGDPLSYGELEMIAEGGASSSAQAPMASWNPYVFEGTTYDGKVHGHKYEVMQDEYCMIGRLTSMMTGEVAESMHCVEHGDLPDSWDEPVEPNLDDEECLDEPYDPETGEPPVPGGTTGGEDGAGLDDAGSCGCTQTKDQRGGVGGLAAVLLGLWGFARRPKRPASAVTRFTFPSRHGLGSPLAMDEIAAAV